MVRLVGIVAWMSLVAALLLTRSGQAAWVETRVVADTATIDVEREGSAVVGHELTLAVRGGPLKGLELGGADPDAEPLPGATVTPIVRYGVPTPIPLGVTRDEDASLRIDIEHEKGLRTGRYVFRLSYRTNLLARDKLRRRGSGAEVEWVGPRFPDGVDVAKVLFRLPEGPTLPTLPNPEQDDENAALGSTFLSTFRHDGSKVEVELVRAHLAQGEPAVWRLSVSPKIFPGLLEPTPARRDALPTVVPVEESGEDRRLLVLSLLLAGLYAAVVALKWRLFARDCSLLGATPRALLPLPTGLRAALSGSSLAGAAVLATLGDHPTLAGVLLVLSVMAAALLPPALAHRPRGPGQWLPLKDEEAFVGRGPVRAGRFLDAGTLPGIVLFSLVLGSLLVGARLLSWSPYHSVALVLSGICWVPIFCTGLGTQLPVDRAVRPRRFLARLSRVTRSRLRLKVIAWARIPDGSEPDELRLLIRVAHPKAGLVGIEVGLEHQATSGGFLGLPFVMIRAREGSESYATMKGPVLWQRGRRPDERVAILRPVLPTVAASVALVREVVAQLSEASAPPSSRSSKKMAGASSLTAKLRVVSPAHAT